MFEKLKRRFIEGKKVAAPAIIAVLGACGFIFAPVVLGLFALTPLVPILTGAALAILSFRQYGSQSEILKGKNDNTAIGVGYTHILMGSIIFTSLGFIGTIIGPAAAIVLPIWYGTIALTALSALCAGGYKKLQEDWSKSPLRILKWAIKFTDFILSFIPSRVKNVLSAFLGSLHPWLGETFYKAQIGLFFILTAFFSPALIIAATITGFSSLYNGEYARLRESLGKSSNRFVRGAIKFIDPMATILGNAVAYVVNSRPIKYLREKLDNGYKAAAQFIFNHTGFNLYIENSHHRLLAAFLITQFVFLGAAIGGGMPLAIIGAAGVAISSVQLIRAMNVMPVRVASVIEESCMWIGICAGIFIDNPILKFYTIYTLVSVAALKVTGYIGGKIFDVENTKITNASNANNDKPSLVATFREMPKFVPIKDLVCNQENKLPVAVNFDDAIEQETQRLKQEYKHKYRTDAYEARKAAKEEFAKLISNFNLINNIKYLVQYLPKNLYWLATHISAAPVSEAQYIESSLAYLNKLNNYDPIEERRLLKGIYAQKFKVAEYQQREAKKAELAQLRNSSTLSDRLSSIIRSPFYTMYWNINHIEKPPSRSRYIKIAINNKESILKSLNKDAQFISHAAQDYARSKKTISEDEFVLKQLRQKQDLAEKLNSASIETEAYHLMNKLQEFHNEDYARNNESFKEKVAQYKNSPNFFVNTLLYYPFYAYLTIRWYLTRPFIVAKLFNVFINNKANTQEMIVKREHFKETPQVPELNIDLNAFSVENTLPEIMQQFSIDSFDLKQKQFSTSTIKDKIAEKIEFLNVMKDCFSSGKKEFHDFLLKVARSASPINTFKQEFPKISSSIKAEHANILSTKDSYISFLCSMLASDPFQDLLDAADDAPINFDAVKDVLEALTAAKEQDENKKALENNHKNTILQAILDSIGEEENQFKTFALKVVNFETQASTKELDKLSQELPADTHTIIKDVNNHKIICETLRQISEVLMDHDSVDVELLADTLKSLLKKEENSELNATHNIDNDTAILIALSKAFTIENEAFVQLINKIIACSKDAEKIYAQEIMNVAAITTIEQCHKDILTNPENYAAISKMIKTQVAGDLVNHAVEDYAVTKLLTSLVAEGINAQLDELTEIADQLQIEIDIARLDASMPPLVLTAHLNNLPARINVALEYLEAAIVVRNDFMNNPEEKEKQKQAAYHSFENNLEKFLIKLKTGKDLAMDKAASSVEKMQKLGVEFIEYVLAEMRTGNPDRIHTAKGHINEIILQTTDKCAQAPFTVLAELHAKYVLGPKIVADGIKHGYPAKKYIALNLQRIRRHNINALIEYFGGNDLIKSIFFHMDFLDHHDHNYILKALKGLNLEYFSEMNRDLSTDSIDVLKELGSKSVAYIIERILMISDTLYSPDCIINIMYQDLYNSTVNKLNYDFGDEVILFKEFNALSCLERWAAEKNDEEIFKLLAEIKTNLEELALENAETNRATHDPILEQKAKALLGTMLMDQDVIEFTEKHKEKQKQQTSDDLNDQELEFVDKIPLGQTRQLKHTETSSTENSNNTPVANNQPAQDGMLNSYNGSLSNGHVQYNTAKAADLATVLNEAKQHLVKQNLTMSGMQ